MYYSAKFIKEDNGYTVTFRNIPEAITCGADIPEAIGNGRGCFTFLCRNIL
ncbi:conserved hypothetical protein [Xenorhabdus nematophila ATCC 19061]|uniref:Uncharacterized protein n=1 Tax=Xenorhabdus nematophila (strain ATCC 19061 / DSM 3370 / CCUG 14189 / LMG 1036 / NCIMB 9965 / AN6) TaxID=406817 RepID=D3VD40_XENNA|nr:conserved hypothetical protein [Xenorhabdus nematophila ATCC 19061]CEK22786.1 conserved hypothetical protein [Xenorhabdus nematophila AN6/1]